MVTETLTLQKNTHIHKLSARVWERKKIVRDDVVSYQKHTLLKNKREKPKTEARNERGSRKETGFKVL